MLERSFEILLRLRARDVFPGAWELIAQQLSLPSGPAGPRAGESGWLYERIYRAGAPLERPSGSEGRGRTAQRAERVIRR